MKKKISLKDYTKKAEALKMIEIDSAATEIYGEFEKYFIENNHAEKLSQMIVKAASNGKTYICFDSEDLDEWYKGEKLTYYSKHQVTNQRYLDSNVLKKITIINNNKMHLSYGKFLICKMAEQLPSVFDGKVTVVCKLDSYTGEECKLYFDWSDENCRSNKIYIRDFFPLTSIFGRVWDWNLSDDWSDKFLNAVVICFILLCAVMCNIGIGLIFSVFSVSAANIVFWAAFILEIAINFVERFKPKKNLFYEGNVFND